ncbi:hypothetical protein Tco_1405110 [Tanacetum coccineum]
MPVPSSQKATPSSAPSSNPISPLADLLKPYLRFNKGHHVGVGLAPRVEDLGGLRYGYIKNHKKTVKNRQARTRESEEYKAEARKVKPQSKSAKKSQRSLEDKILVPEPDSSSRCARCGTPVDGPSCHGCAFLRKKFDEDLLAYCVENFQDTSELPDDNTNDVNAPSEPIIVNQDPGEKSSQEPPQIDHNCPHFDYQCQPINETCYEPNPSYDYSGFNHPQPPQNSVDCQEALDKILKELEELKRDQRMLKELKKQIAKEQTVKENMSIEEMMHEQQLVDRKIKEITNDLAYEDEKYAAACRYMLSVTYDDEDDYIPLAITTDLPIEEPDNSLKMGDEHLDTISAKESDEVIKSSVENLVPIPREFEESLINRDTSIDYSSKIDPIFEEFSGELAHIAPIPPGIVEADFNQNDDTSSDDDDFEDIEYVSLDEVDQEEKEFDLEDILQIQDVTLREKLLNVSRLISNIESLKDNPSPVMDSDSSITSLSFSDNSLPEFESFSDHTEETRSGSTTTHANYSLPEYESFHFDNPSFPRPPPEPPDVCLNMLYNDESFEPSGDENIVVSNVKEDDSFTFIIRTFLPFLTYPEVSPLYCSTRSEDLIFDPGIVTFHKPVDQPNKFFEASRVRLIYPVQTRASHPLSEISLGRSISFRLID